MRLTSLGGAVKRLTIAEARDRLKARLRENSGVFLEIRRYLRMRIAVLCAVMASCFSIVTPAAQQAPVNVSETIERVKRGIAPIVCVAKNEGGVFPKTILGSSFFVSASGAFMTANHVLQAAANVPGGCELALYIPVEGWATQGVQRVRFYTFAPCTTNGALDIAHCQTQTDFSVESAETKGVSITPLILETAIQGDGTPVIFSGFPFARPQPLTSRGSIAAYQGAGSAEGTLWIDKTAWGGSSGGPVYLEDGRVIGMIIQRSVNEAAGLAVARPAFYFGSVLPQR